MGADVTYYVLVIIVLLNASATITLWRAAARRPGKLKKKFTTALMRSKPIVPKHNPPKVAGDGFPVDDEDRLFFAEFKEFADVVNWWLADEDVGTNWRLQELPDTDLKHSFSDMPQFGRRYDVFHNQVKVGTLEVSPGVEYGSEKPDVRTSIQLKWVRLLDVYTIREFLGGIALHVCDPHPGTMGYLEARAAIEGCLTNALWDAQRISEYDLEPDYGDIELQLNGTPIWYLQRREAPAFKARFGPGEG